MDCFVQHWGFQTKIITKIMLKKKKVGFVSKIKQATTNSIVSVNTF